MKVLMSLILAISGILVVTKSASAVQILACTGLGNNSTAEVTIEGNQITVNNSGNVETGTAQTSASGGLSFTQFSGDTQYVGVNDTLTPSSDLLASGTGQLVWSMANINPQWIGTCHPWSATDSEAVSCKGALADYASTNSTVSTLVENEFYQMSTPDAEAGADLVYDFKMVKTGVFCAVSSMIPVSCPAIISDKIATRARQDGSSSGSPFVRQLSGNAYVAGVNDAESGEFIYNVTVLSEGNTCKVSSMIRQ